MRNKFLLFAVFDAICAVSANVYNVSFTCPNEFARYNNGCYYLSKKTATWQESLFDCVHLSRNSNLVVLDNKWKDKSIRDFLQNSELPQVKRWIAGIYDWKQQVWMWGTTGQKIKYQAFSRRKKGDDKPWKCIYTNPDLYHRWSSEDCFRENYYICEAPAKFDTLY